MATRMAISLTNVFHVRNDESLEALLKTMYCGEDKLHHWTEERTDEAGGKYLVHKLGSYDVMEWYPIPHDHELFEFTDDHTDVFLYKMSELLYPGTVFVLTSIEHEKLRYADGHMYIVKAGDSNFQSIWLSGWGNEILKKMGIDSWEE